MATMYWRVCWKKKGEVRDSARFEVICTSEGQCERYVRMLEKDSTVEKVEVVKELILGKKD